MKASDILKTCKEQGYKYVRLFNQEGQQVVAMNNPSVSLEKKAEAIEKALSKSSLYPDGQYLIEFKPSPTGLGVKIPVMKGKKNEQSQEPARDSHFNYDALKRLEDGLAKLESLLADLEAEPEQEEPLPKSVSESPEPTKPSLVEKLLTDSVPIILPFIAPAIGRLADRAIPEKKPEPVPVSEPGENKGLTSWIYSVLSHVPPDELEPYLAALQQCDERLCSHVINSINQTSVS